MTMQRRLSYTAAAVAAGCAVLQVLGRTAGSARGERHAELPGDDVVPGPKAVTNHAVTIAAAPEAIWPWLTQMGWHRGGYYTPRWVDLVFFPANWPSLDRLDPGLTRDLVPGDTIPDGPPGTAWYEVHTVSAPATLVLHSMTHVPPGWQRFGARMEWTWAFRLTSLPGGRTRLQVRVRAKPEPWWLAAVYNLVLIPADAIMATGMLRGIKRRAEKRQA